MASGMLFGSGEKIGALKDHLGFVSSRSIMSAFKPT